MFKYDTDVIFVFVYFSGRGKAVCKISSSKGCQCFKVFFLENYLII